MRWFKKRPYLIERLYVGPGETLVVKVPHPVTAAQVATIRDQFVRALPDGIHVLVVTGAVDMAVVGSRNA